MPVEAMLKTHPAGLNTSSALIACIEECLRCAQTCTSCADACLAEDIVEALRPCIRFNLDCADICAVTAAVATRRTGDNDAVLRVLLEACVAACRRCGDECASHAEMHEHCKICADECRRCEDACRAALSGMTTPA